MKKLIYLILPVLLYGCYDDLEPELYNTINPGTFFKTEADVNAAVTAIYNCFRANDWGGWLSSSHLGYQLWPESATDVMSCQWGWDNTKYAIWTPHDWLVTPFYLKYSDISRATLTLSRIEDVDISQDIKNRYLAEVKCARGMMKFMLYDLYGPIPVASLEVLQNPQDEIFVERLTKEEMVISIENDLNEAAEILPVSYSDSDWGRFNKGTALTWLMKLYLNEHCWSEAETVGREILTFGYSLQSDYASVFSNSNQRNSEIIYAIPGNDTWGNMYQTSCFPWIASSVNPNIMKWGGFRMTWEFYDTYEASDLRKNVLWDEFVGVDSVTYNRANPGGHLSEGVVPMKYDEDPSQAGYISSTDWIILRYSDVLLMLAEAIANNNGSPTQEAVDLINQVRNRSGLESRNLSFYPDLQTFNIEILLERGHELFLEGWRRQDLIRHGKFVEYVKAQQPLSSIQPYMVLFPLPQSAVDEGKGHILQNPGY